MPEPARYKANRRDSYIETQTLATNLYTKQEGEEEAQARLAEEPLRHSERSCRHSPAEPGRNTVRTAAAVEPAMP
jgi:hypothetical protein